MIKEFYFKYLICYMGECAGLLMVYHCYLMIFLGSVVGTVCWQVVWRLLWFFWPTRYQSDETTLM